jgi:hypothetical protein
MNSINGSVEIDTRQLSAGVYFLELRGPKLSRSQRFQVVH